MVRVKPLETIKKNYAAGATVAPTRYKDAVARTTGVISAAIEAEDLFAAKMSEAVANKSRAKGLARVSDEDWRKAAMNKGSARIGPGMTAAVDKQATNYAPFRSALEGVSLPARTADPMANIDARVKPIVARLVETKKAQLG